MLRIRGFCVFEFVNSAQQQPVCYLMSFFCILSSSQDSMHCTLSLTVCKCTPCQRASFNSTTDSFSWGHDPYTLACKARPSFDRCWTSLEHNSEEHLGAQVPHQVEEAGSIVFHSSRNASEFKNDNKEAQVTTSAAAKESEEFLDKDAEILKLIEERRSIPKGEKHRLKDLSKSKKNASEKK